MRATLAVAAAQLVAALIGPASASAHTKDDVAMTSKPDRMPIVLSV